MPISERMQQVALPFTSIMRRWCLVRPMSHAMDRADSIPRHCAGAGFVVSRVRGLIARSIQVELDTTPWRCLEDWLMSDAGGYCAPNRGALRRHRSGDRARS